ncbi:MAG: glycerate kinase [Phycisphaerales bacterium]|nr:glycerate kinase [Phycisphaerales bacterium]
MRFLIAPDKFRDAISATDAATALAAGIQQALPAAKYDICPLADGGEGTGPLLAAAWHAGEQSAEVHDARYRLRPARWWYEAGGRRAIVEMAQASGLEQIPESDRNPEETSSFGTGELLRAAMAAGAEEIWLAVGGSATVDGGAGCLQALGWDLCDEDGLRLPAPVTGGMLRQVKSIAPPRAVNWPRIIVLADVRNAMLGPQGAAAVFGPQKGATPTQVARLTEGLEHWADLIRRATEREPNDAFSGAAGGIAGGLRAALQAECRAGFDAIADAVNLDRRLLDCDLCLTGEGRLDPQSFTGKVLAGVAIRALRQRREVVAFVGTLQGLTATAATERLGLAEAVVITSPNTPLPAAVAATRENLTRCAAEWASRNARRLADRTLTSAE